MIFRRTAPQGAITRVPCTENAASAVWFRAGSSILSRSAQLRPTKAWLSRIGGALWVGTCLAASSSGAAITPAAAADASRGPSREKAGSAPIELALLPFDDREPGLARDDPAPADAAEACGRRARASIDAPHASPRLPRAESDQPALAATLTLGGAKVSRTLVETVIRAAEAIDVDPVYMLALADKESSFSAEAKAGTSSAEGLFQFVNSTWLEMIRSHGARHGYEAAAAAVETVRGELTITNDVMREWVLGLRRDAYLSAVMAGEMLKRDRAKVERRIGRDLSRSEYYLVHFLGAASAGKLMEIVNGKPKQSAPAAFPQAARANKTLFFTREGRRTRHLTVGEVYTRLDRMIDMRLDRYIGVSAIQPVMRTSL
jgi:hypothetical protein